MGKPLFSFSLRMCGRRARNKCSCQNKHLFCFYNGRRFFKTLKNLPGYFPEVGKLVRNGRMRTRILLTIPVFLLLISSLGRSDLRLDFDVIKVKEYAAVKGVIG